MTVRRPDLQVRRNAVRRPALQVRPDAGWTLIELLIVISLILILSSVALTAYGTTVTRSKETALLADLGLMRDAIDQHYADNGRYPDSLHALVPLYLRRIPKDPFTRSADTWVTTPADTRVGAPATMSPGIYDVKSGWTGTALDGSRYAEW